MVFGIWAYTAWGLHEHIEWSNLLMDDVVFVTCSYVTTPAGLALLSTDICTFLGGSCSFTATWAFLITWERAHSSDGQMGVCMCVPDHDDVMYGNPLSITDPLWGEIINPSQKLGKQCGTYLFIVSYQIVELEICCTNREELKLIHVSKRDPMLFVQDRS